MKQFLCMWMIIGMLCPVAIGAEPDEPDNAALRYWQAFAVMPEEELHKRVENWSDLLTGKLDEPMLKLIDDSNYALSCLHGGAALNECDWGLNYVEGPELLMPHLGKARDLARLAMLRARVRFEKGDTAGGIDDILAVFELSRDAGIDPIMINVLVQFAIDNAAIDVLARFLPTMDAATKQSLADRLDKFPPSDVMHRTWETESTYFIGWFEERTMKIPAANDEEFAARVLSLPIFDDDARKRFRDAGGVPGKSEMPTEIAQLKEYLKEVATLSDLPPEKQTEELAKLDAKYKSSRLHRMVAPSSGKAFDARAKWRLRRAMLRAAVAVSIEGEAALKKPEFADPFEKKPFQYSKTEGGFQLHATPLSDGKEIVVTVGM